MSTTQDRQLVLRAVLMACWQRPNRQPVILHSDRGTQFTSYEYQQFLKDHHITLSMSDVGPTPRPRAFSACLSASGSTDVGT